MASTAELKQTTVGVTSHYGPRMLNGRLNIHKGTDFAFSASMGVSVFGTGKVIFAGRGTGANAERGLYVQVTHAPGIETSYHSLSRITVSVGQTIPIGTIVGYGGKTATGATGNHCHVGLWLNGSHVDLEKYLTPGKVVRITNTGTVSDIGSTPFPNTANKPSVPTSTPNNDSEAEEAARLAAEAAEKLRKKKELVNNMAGTMYRISSGQGVNGVYWQDGPNEPLLQLDLTQYQAYDLQGYTLANFDAMVIQALQRRVGVYELDGTYGRKVLADPDTPKTQQHNGFKVWLPG